MSTVYKAEHIILARLGVKAADLHVESQITPGDVPVVCIKITDPEGIEKMPTIPMGTEDAQRLAYQLLKGAEEARRALTPTT